MTLTETTTTEAADHLARLDRLTEAARQANQAEAATEAAEARLRHLAAIEPGAEATEATLATLATEEATAEAARLVRATATATEAEARATAEALLAEAARQVAWPSVVKAPVSGFPACLPSADGPCHLAPTAEQRAARFAILGLERNTSMLMQIAHSLVRGQADRQDLTTEILLALASAPTLTPAAEAVGLLAAEAGQDGRGRAHHIVRNLARHMARSLITTRDREIPFDTTDQARAAATEADGTWQRPGRMDKDHAKGRINGMHAFGDEMGSASATARGQYLAAEATEVEFRRSSETIKERTYGPSTFDGHGRVQILKEARLEDMLRQELRTGGIHDYGRLDRLDRLALATWQAAFSAARPPTTTALGQALGQAIDRLATAEAARMATALLVLTGHRRLAATEETTTTEALAAWPCLLGAWPTEGHRLAARPTATDGDLFGGGRLAARLPDRGMRARSASAATALLVPTEGHPGGQAEGLLMSGHRRGAEARGTWRAPTAEAEAGWSIGGPNLAALASVADGHVKCFADLVVACTSATIERARTEAAGTTEYMRCHWSTLLRLAGQDDTTANVRAVKKLTRSMATEAGADQEGPAIGERPPSAVILDRLARVPMPRQEGGQEATYRASVDQAARLARLARLAEETTARYLAGARQAEAAEEAADRALTIDLAADQAGRHLAALLARLAGGRRAGGLGSWPSVLDLFGPAWRA